MLAWTEGSHTPNPQSLIPNRCAEGALRSLDMTPPWKTYLDSLQLKDLGEIFRTSRPVIGMVHCWPLPGAPGYTGYGMQAIIDNALRDAHALAEGGVDGLIVENMWDIPFRAGPHVQPES